MVTPSAGSPVRLHGLQDRATNARGIDADAIGVQLGNAIDDIAVGSAQGQALQMPHAPAARSRLHTGKSRRVARLADIDAERVHRSRPHTLSRLGGGIV